MPRYLLLRQEATRLRLNKMECEYRACCSYYVNQRGHSDIWNHAAPSQADYESRLGETQEREKILNCAYSKTRAIGNRQTYLQRTPIVLQSVLQRKLVKPGHSLAHIGKTKTKQILREKYWFPLMNSMIDTAIDCCYERNIAMKENKEEPIKLINIPSRPWDTVSIDHGSSWLA